MPVEMVLHYDHKLVTRGGRSVAFVADQPRMVADDAVDECVKLGARRVDAKPAGKPAPAPKKPEPAPQGVSREDAIRSAIEILKEENDSNKFAGTGRPKVPEVSKLAGFQADANEVTRIWDEINGSGNE